MTRPGWDFRGRPLAASQAVNPCVPLDRWDMWPWKSDMKIPMTIPARSLSGDHRGRTINYRGDLVELTAISHKRDGSVRVRCEANDGDHSIDMGITFAPDDVVTVVPETGGV